MGIKNQFVKRPPLWKGPESNEENGGITFSMLSRFIVCRERFRVQYLEGWAPAPSFNARMEFGNMWHICEEALAQKQCSMDGQLRPITGTDQSAWEIALKDYVYGMNGLSKQYPFDRDAINNWYGICRTMFPIYVEYWTQNFDQNSRKVIPLLQEHVFNVPYTLPSGRTVRLRGKWDEVVLVKDATSSGIWIGDHKTKSRIEGLAISRQLTGDLQMLLYLVALCQISKGGNT